MKNLVGLGINKPMYNIALMVIKGSKGCWRLLRLLLKCN